MRIFYLFFLLLIVNVSAVKAEDEGVVNTATRSTRVMDMPNIQLTRRDGSLADFPAELDKQVPVILTFDYTSCTTVCPAIHAVFSKVYRKLEEAGKPVQMVSISIDPEYDTPGKLREFDEEYKQSVKWQHYTGKPDAVINMQKTFRIYKADKMKHIPVVFLRGKTGSEWVRLDGLPTVQQVLDEYNELLEEPGDDDMPHNEN